MSRFLEKNQIVSAIVPVDLSTAANNGDWVSLTGYEYAVVVVHKGAGTAGDDPVITLKQATDASGTSSKALNFTVVHSKVGAQTGIGTFTRTTQAAANTYTDAVSAEAQGLFVVEVKADQLDVDNGFTHIRVEIPDVGTNAQIGDALYILCEPRYASATMPSAIA